MHVAVLQLELDILSLILRNQIYVTVVNDGKHPAAATYVRLF